MSIRQINQSHRYSNVKYIVKSHNTFGIYHRMRFFCILCQEQRHEAIAIPRGKNRTQTTKMDVAMEMSNFLHSLLTSRTTQEIGNAINVRNSKVRIMRSNT